MKSISFLAVFAATFLQGAIASPQAAVTTDLGILPGDDKSCSTYATITTRRPFICDIVCEATRTCRPGEPTGKPEPTGTVTSGCTVELLTGGICDCPTCIARPTAKPTPYKAF